MKIQSRNYSSQNSAMAPILCMDNKKKDIWCTIKRKVLFTTRNQKWKEEQ